MSPDPNAENDFDFGFSGYRPTWLGYEAAGQAVREIMAKHVGSRLLDIRGVTCDESWEANSPMVLQFQSGAVSINTKCDYLWAIDPWGDYCFTLGEQEPSWNESYTSVLGLLNLMCLKGQELEAVLWPVSRGDDVEQSFVLRLGKYLLRIFDAGDELGVEVISNSVRSQHLTPIISEAK